MTERTGYETTEMTRRRLQAALFRAIDEKTRLHITSRHRDCWRYDQAIAEAREALQQFDLAATVKTARAELLAHNAAQVVPK